MQWEYKHVCEDNFDFSVKLSLLLQANTSQVRVVPHLFPFSLGLNMVSDT